MDVASYCCLGLLSVAEKKAKYPSIILMQNGALNVVNKNLESPAIFVIASLVWPLHSPYHNPIKSLWNTIEDFIQVSFPDAGVGDRVSLCKLKLVIRGA